MTHMGECCEESEYFYDYEEAIEEIESDLGEGLLSIDGEILVVRGEAVEIGRGHEYRPIIDWHYADEPESYEEALKAVYLEECASMGIEPSEKMLARNAIEGRRLDELRKLDEPDTFRAIVGDVLGEMREWNADPQ